MPDIAVLRARLVEAEEALHHLMIGDKEVTVTIGGYGATTFSEINRVDLERYIGQLKNAIASKERRPRRRPIYMKF